MTRIVPYRFFILLLLIASGVAMAAKWVRVPYTLMLVVGLMIISMHFLPAVHISPELITLIFLPALLFEAAWNLKLDCLRENILPISLCWPSRRLRAELGALRKRGVITERVYKALESELSQVQEEQGRMARYYMTDRVLERQQTRRIHSHLIDVKKSRLAERVREGMLSQSVYEELNDELDEHLSRAQEEPACLRTNKSRRRKQRENL